MTRISAKNIQDFNTLMKRAGKITLITHHNPDGDAIGSSLGLYHYLVKITGSNAVINTIVPNDVPVFLNWLPGIDKLIIGKKNKEKALKIIENTDIVICLDFNIPSRAGVLEDALKNTEATKILIDHHPNPNCNSDLTISNTFYSSTAELVYDVIKSTGVLNNIDKDIATCLFTGIMTDTGCFSFNSSSGNTYSAISSLLGFGLDKNTIYDKVYNNFSVERMRLLGHCLGEKMVVLPEYQTAYISIDKNDQQKYNYVPGDAEGFVNYPLSVKQIMFSVLFIEHEKQVNISFRSKNKFNANQFSKEVFGGGGHHNAAGAQSFLSLKETIEKFKAALPKYKHGFI